MGARHGVTAPQVRQHVRLLLRIELPPGVGKAVATATLVAREFDALADIKPIEWPC